MNINEIKSNEISIIIQGPVLGNSKDCYDKQVTFQCIESVKKIFPESEIILSTWKNSDVTNLNYNVLVENEDPGSIVTILYNGQKYTNNINRQIVSTKNGIIKSTKKYIMKLRSDMLLTNDDFLYYYNKYNKYSFQYKFLINKIIIMPCWNLHWYTPYKQELIFHYCDWFYFGLKEDILNIWDIPLMKESNCEKLYFGKIPEQYIILNFLNKYLKSQLSEKTIEELIIISDNLLVSNFISLSAEQLGLKSLKYSNSEYIINGYNSVQFYTFNDWKKLYNKYCEENLLIIPNIKELIYKLIYYLRIIIPRYLKQKSPNLYNQLKNLKKIFYKSE